MIEDRINEKWRYFKPCLVQLNWARSRHEWYVMTSVINIDQSRTHHPVFCGPVLYVPSFLWSSALCTQFSVVQCLMYPVFCGPVPFVPSFLWSSALCTQCSVVQCFMYPWPSVLWSSALCAHHPVFCGPVLYVPMTQCSVVQCFMYLETMAGWSLNCNYSHIHGKKIKKIDLSRYLKI